MDPNWEVFQQPPEDREGVVYLLKRRACSAVLQDESHSEWVSCVRFSPNSSNPIIVSCGWDKLVKVSFKVVLVGF